MCDELNPETMPPPATEAQSADAPTDPLAGHIRASPPLSPTEKKVYALLLQRFTEQQVADQLGRSPNTIHVHVRNIYRKLGIRSRQELYELSEQEDEQR